MCICVYIYIYMYTHVYVYETNPQLHMAHVQLGSLYLHAFLMIRRIRNDKR